MSNVQFTNAARKDLREIFTYTTKTWGIVQARQYSEQLKQHTIAIGEFRAHTKPILGASADIHQSHCRKHIFVFESKGNKFLIVRILHEAMNIPHHRKLDTKHIEKITVPTKVIQLQYIQRYSHTSI